MNEQQEDCFKCGESIDFKSSAFDFDMDKLDYFHKKCEHKQKCDYCDDYVDKVRATPYMADMVIDCKMCEGCWKMTRSQFIGSEGFDIGEFDQLKV